MTIFQPARRALLLLLCCSLAACSALSPFSSTTKLDLQLTGSEQLNPDVNGRPSPIVVRLYELRRPAAFESGDFFTLYQRGREVLGTDLVAEEELSVRPGESLYLQLAVQPGSHYVGVIAAYRDLPDSRWRHVIALTPEAINQVQLEVAALGLHDSATPAADQE